MEKKESLSNGYVRTRRVSIAIVFYRSFHQEA